MTWHPGCMSLLYCSQLEQPRIGMIVSLKFNKNDWSSFLQIVKQFYSKRRAYHAQLEVISLVKKGSENVQHYAL